MPWRMGTQESEITFDQVSYKDFKGGTQHLWWSLEGEQDLGRRRLGAWLWVKEKGKYFRHLGQHKQKDKSD